MWNDFTSQQKVHGRLPPNLAFPDALGFNFINSQSGSYQTPLGERPVRQSSDAKLIEIYPQISIHCMHFRHFYTRGGYLGSAFPGIRGIICVVQDQSFPVIFRKCNKQHEQW